MICPRRWIGMLYDPGSEHFDPAQIVSKSQNRTSLALEGYPASTSGQVAPPEPDDHSSVWRRLNHLWPSAGNAGGGKGPQFKTDAIRGEGPGDWETYQLR